MKIFTKIKKDYIFLLFVLLFSIPAILGLIHKGFFVSDDGNWMVIRLSAFYEALRDGQFPVRFIPRLNNGYGYPVSDFLYPGYLYFGSLIHLFKISFVDTVKIIFGISLISSAVFSYLWLSKNFKKSVAVIGSLIYLYLPYHLYDVYHRGSLGEVIALAILPLILFAIDKRNTFIIGISVFLLMISHNSLALIFLPLIIIYALIGLNKNNYRTIMIPIFLGILMSSFFIIPAVFDLKYTVFSQTKISDWQKYFAPPQLLGYLSMGVYLICLTFLVLKKDFNKKPLLFLIIGSISIFLSSSLSYSFWSILPSNLIQFPFRFLSFSLVASAFLVGYLMDKIKDKRIVVVISIFLFLALFKSESLIPTNYQYYEEGFYSTNLDTTTVKNEYMPKWVIKKPDNLYQKKIVTTLGSKVSNAKISSQKILFSIYQKESGIISVNTIYFPGWVLFIDGKPAKINYLNDQGIITFVVDKGDHNVELLFKETPIRLLSDLVSVFAFVSLLLYSGNKKLKILKHD